MRTVTPDKTYTVVEYIRHEWTAPRKSEFINGKLFEMPGEKDINNEIAGVLYILFVSALRSKGYHVYNHDVKVKVFGENKYYYPDVFITKEASSAPNEYIKVEPVLIVEIVSASTHVHDYVDKYIDYTKIPSLQYYLVVEPETILLTCHKRSDNNEWIATKYTNLEDSILLDELGVSFSLKNIYNYE